MKRLVALLLALITPALSADLESTAATVQVYGTPLEMPAIEGLNFTVIGERNAHLVQMLNNPGLLGIYLTDADAALADAHLPPVMDRFVFVSTEEWMPAGYAGSTWIDVIEKVWRDESAKEHHVAHYGTRYTDYRQDSEAVRRISDRVVAYPYVATASNDWTERKMAVTQVAVRVDGRLLRLDATDNAEQTAWTMAIGQRISDQILAINEESSSSRFLDALPIDVSMVNLKRTTLILAVGFLALVALFLHHRRRRVVG